MIHVILRGDVKISLQEITGKKKGKIYKYQLKTTVTNALQGNYLSKVTSFAAI